MKKRIKDFLQKKGLYYSVKYSRLFNVYKNLFKPAVVRQEKREVRFYQSFLPACDLVFDIGANDGHKTAALLSLSKKIICCEPESENVHILMQRFRKLKDRVVIENKALSDAEGTARLYVHHPGSAFNTLSNKWRELLEESGEKRWNESINFSAEETVNTTTLDQLIEQYGRPDYVKIDVEGFEERVLRGLSQPVRFLSFETLLPEYQVELQHCLESINSLDKTALFNIASREQLLFHDFLGRQQLENWLQKSTDGQSLEIIVKMKA